MAFIPAIPTEFKGVIYRSRLEAKYAVLFSELNIEYRYEMEGFILPSGDRYLPDFFLPQVHMWAEVKPFDMTETERRKCRQLCAGTGFPVLRIEGPPALKTYWAFLPLPGSTDDFFDVDETDFLLDVDYHQRLLYEQEHRFFGCIGRFDEDQFTLEYQQAVFWANNARFGRVA